MTTASVAGVEYSMVSPEGAKNRTVRSGFRIASRGRSNSSKASAARTPVQCTGSPLVPCSSNSATDAPLRASCHAAYSPAGPPPTTTTSWAGFIRVERRLYGFLSRDEPHLRGELIAERWKRRRDDSLHVEPASKAIAQRTPVEPFVIVERNAVAAVVEDRPRDVLRAPREQARDVLPQRVRAGACVVADAAPSRHAAHRLLDQQRQ